MKYCLLKKPLIIFTILLLSTNIFAQDIATYNKNCKESYDKKEYSAVINYANMSIVAAPNGEAYWWRALAYYQTTKYSLAIPDITKALTFYVDNKSNSMNLYVLRADCYYYNKNYEQAADDYELILSKYTYSDKKRLYTNLGKCYIKMEYYEDAEDVYNEAIKLATSDIELSGLYCDLADLKFKYTSVKIDLVIADYNTAIRKNSKNKNAYLGRGNCRLVNKEYDLALSDYQTSVRLFEAEGIGLNQKSIAELYRLICVSFYAKNNMADAKTAVLKSMEYEPNDGSANWTMANILATERGNKDAAAYFRKAVTLLTDKKQRANCYTEWRDYEIANLNYNQAMQCVDESIKLSAGNADYYWMKARIYEKKRDYNSAIQWYDSTRKYVKNDSISLNNIYLRKGKVRLQQNENAAALRDLQQSVSYNANYENTYELGKFFKQIMKQDALADLNLKKALKFSIAGKDTTVNYAYTAAVMGDAVTAERIVKQKMSEASTDNQQLLSELYNAACIYTILGNNTKGVQYLEKALIAGYYDFDHFYNDVDLDPLRSLPAYKNLLIKYKIPAPIF